MKLLRSFLMLLLLPLAIGSFFEEAKMPLSSSGHSLALILILLIICGLALGLVQLDEIDRLREIGSSGQESPYHYATSREGTWRVDLATPAKESASSGKSKCRPEQAGEETRSRADPIVREILRSPSERLDRPNRDEKDEISW